MAGSTETPVPAPSPPSSPAAASGDSAAATAEDDPVAALVAAGEHARAAEVAVARGELARAVTLLERLWRFADAVPIAISLGDLPRAIRLALDAGDPARAVELAESISATDSAGLRAAAAAFASRGRHWESARAHERSGELEAAARAYRRAGSLLDAGRTEEAAGRLHDAGVSYERAREVAATADDRAAAELALARLLGRLGRHRDAARLLQGVVTTPAFRIDAGRALVGELTALGYRMGAGDLLARLRAESPDLPATLEELAAVESASGAAGTSPVGQVAAASGLAARPRFRVKRALGAGATSQVFLAEDTLLGTEVALKMVAIGPGSREPERQAYARFAREAEAAGRLRHPNIVTLHDLDASAGLFVVELMSGGTLEARMTDDAGEVRALPPAATRRLALDVLAALATAHERGIVHRDIKPQNIFFDGAGNAKLGDFGAAHLADFGQTQTGGLIGTVAFMSPEQITGGAIGPAADLYALAVTLFQALTGRLPFLGPDLVAQHLGEEAPLPSTVRPELGDTFDEVIRRALKKAPAERWQSALEMADAVRAWPATAVPGRPPRAEPHLSSPEQILAAGPAGATTGVEPRAVTPTQDLFIGRTRAGALYRREDPRLARPVLVEVRHAPFDAAQVRVVQRLAAAGGPKVQRVLALDEESRTIVFERFAEPTAPIATLPPGDAAALHAIRSALVADGVPAELLPEEAVVTDAGPVLLLVVPETE